MKSLYTLLISIVLLTACQNDNKSNSPVNNQETNNEEYHDFTKEGNLTIIDTLEHIKAKFDIELAKDSYERETGLMYRKTMKDNQAMLFIFEYENPRYFWMKNTYIPLDIIYINANKQIVNIAKNAKPLDEKSLSSKLPAMYVLEIKAGLSDTYNIHIGDKVTW